jgi:hypothetical protein
MNIERFNFCSQVILLDDFDNSIIGKNYTTGGAVYSIEKLIDEIINKLKLNYDEAVEHFDQNIGGAFLGENQPIFIWKKEASK